MTFGKQQLMIQSKNIFPLCRDNLEQCVNKATSLIQSKKFLAILEALSGKRKGEIETAFNGMRRNRLSAAVLDKLPYVSF